MRVPPIDTTLSQRSDPLNKEVKRPFPKRRENKPMVKRLSSILQKGASSLLKEKKKKMSGTREPSFGGQPQYFLPLNALHTKSSAIQSIGSTKAVLEIFDRMCQEMTLMEEKGNATTTITLQTLGSASPTRIIIEEFSTAPRLFNVTIEGNPAILAAISSEAASFMDFIHKKELAFGIHRIDTALPSEEEKAQQEQTQEDEK